MADDQSFTLSHKDFYAPVELANTGRRYRPATMPESWRHQESGPWTHWQPRHVGLPDQGWKVHVSSTLANTATVLDIVSEACVEFGVPFKHLAGRQAFLYVHGKHANRAQSGKFCTLYPPSTEIADRVLRRLALDFTGVSGPYVLTDRRFGTSQCVTYRYGAFRDRFQVEADGSRKHILVDGNGAESADERRPAFRLPPGVTDPFAMPSERPAGGPLTIGGYTFESVVQHANSGGAYRFRTPDDQPLFLKEARAHNGYEADGTDARARLTSEYLVLRAVHARAPGLCPEPLALFDHWEHSYLATEWVPGVSLHRWMVSNNPAVRAGEPASAFHDYHRRCLAVLDDLAAQLSRLHELGYVFLDVSPHNVLIDDDDRPRLIDFEAVQHIRSVRAALGTPGFLPPDAHVVTRSDPRELDRYGLASLALYLLFPALDVVDRYPGALELLRSDLAERTTVPPRLWSWGTRYRKPGRPAEYTGLADLAERTADTIEAMARVDDPNLVYPTTPAGYRTNTRCVAYGTAGVVHALRRAGRAVDPAVVRRLRDDSLAAVEDTAPGLLFGSAGIAWVLADLGEHEAADVLLAGAAKHPLAATSATMGGGAAGTAMAMMAAFCRTGENRYLETATRLLDAVTDGGFAPDEPTGLVAGRSGLALALYYLGRLTGTTEPLDRGCALLRTELDRANPLPVDALSFSASARDQRSMVYLHAGSAGVAATLARYVQAYPEFTEPLRLCLRACTGIFTALSGLFTGLAGLVLTTAQAGWITEAHACSAGLYRSAIPWQGGVAWLGEPGQRLSTDLWSGAAGVLLTLRYLVDPVPDPLFTLDQHVPTVSRVLVPHHTEGKE